MNFTQNEEYVILELTSENGNKFAVGYPKSEGYTLELVQSLTQKIQLDSQLINLASSDSYKDINWPVNEDGYTSAEAKQIGITWGNVRRNNPTIPYEYTVSFVNNKGWGFRFKDESGDTYFCTTLSNGNHTIWYNSKKPTMIGVK